MVYFCLKACFPLPKNTRMTPPDKLLLQVPHTHCFLKSSIFFNISVYTQTLQSPPPSSYINCIHVSLSIFVADGFLSNTQVLLSLTVNPISQYPVPSFLTEIWDQVYVLPMQISENKFNVWTEYNRETRVFVFCTFN